MIAFLKAAYHAAPETTPEKAISDGTLQTVGKNADGMPLLSLGVSTKNKRLRVTTVPNSKALSGLTLPGIIFSRESPTYFTNGMASFSATDLSDTVKEKLIISYDDAKLLCDDFFKAAGMSNDFCVGATFVLNDIGDYERPAQNYAYRFYYTRIYNSIPLHFNIQGSYKEDESFSLPWYYEDVQITVDNDGIVDIIWIYPIEIGQTVNEAATLKPFVEIMEIFETMIKTIYESAVLTPETVESNVAFESGGNKTSAIKCIDIDVNEIKLCLIRIREKNADQTEGLLVPAWVFYGHNMATDEAGNISYRLGASDINATVRKDVPVALMAINAVDGSVIDLSKGY